MTSRARAYLVLLMLTAGCEGIADFDRDKITPVTAPPTPFLREAGVADAGREASVADATVSDDSSTSEEEGGVAIDGAISIADAALPDAETSSDDAAADAGLDAADDGSADAQPVASDDAGDAG